VPVFDMVKAIFSSVALDEDPEPVKAVEVVLLNIAQLPCKYSKKFCFK
jgi:hypothetical protein